MTNGILEPLPYSVPDLLNERLALVSEQEKARLLVEHLTSHLAYDPLGWTWELGWRAQHHQVSLPAVRSVTADLAWQARKQGHPYPDATNWEPRLGSQDSTLRRLILVYAEGQRLRFDFKFVTLGQRCDTWLQEFPNDALVLALAAFGAMGRRAPEGMRLYRAAVDCSNADRRSRHVCLAGMWFAHHIENQSQELLDLSSAMMAKGEVDPNLFYRRASALRKLGRFEQAIEDIDRATDMLDVGDNPVHQDFVRERELIVSSIEIEKHIRQLGRQIEDQVSRQIDEQISLASAELGNKIDTAQRVVSDGLLKIVEILGLFLAVIGFVAGSGAIAIQAQGLRDRTISMGFVLIGSLLFFVLLRLVTMSRRK